MSTVLHPELVQSVPLISGIAERALEQRAQDTLVQDPALDQPLTVVIRARNEAATLEPLLQDIAGQQTREVEVVVVDNESTDRTREVAREYGATVVTIARGDFTYPRSMNVGTEAASHDLVFLTVGHALLSTSLSLHAGVRHFQPDSNVAGVFSFSLPSATASRTDRLLDGAASLELLRGPYDVKKARMAVLAATGAMISKAVWEELGRFDERYESGGEDTALARQMLAQGYRIVKEPAMAVHHSHGLGFMGTARELIHSQKVVNGPRPLPKQLLAERQERLDSAL